MINNQWYGILPSKRVKAKQVLGVKRLNLELCLFRSADGKLGCVVDLCSHRGTALSFGKVQANCVACPFHSIEFDEKGACRFIPANGKASQEDMSRYNIRHYPVREHHGIIFLWYGEPEKATEQLPFFDEEITEQMVYSELEDHWNAHYSRCIENQLDVVHLPFVHHNTIGRGNKTVVNGPKVVIDGNVICTSADNEKDEGQTPRKAQDCQLKSTRLNFIFPNVWVNHITDKVKVLIYFAPVDDENTILFLRFYHCLTPFKWLNRCIAPLGNAFDKIVERQDRRVVQTQGPKASQMRSGEKLIPGDGPIIAYRKRREALKQGENLSQN